MNEEFMPKLKGKIEDYLYPKQPQIEIDLSRGVSYEAIRLNQVFNKIRRESILLRAERLYEKPWDRFESIQGYIVREYKIHAGMMHQLFNEKFQGEDAVRITFEGMPKIEDEDVLYFEKFFWLMSCSNEEGEGALELFRRMAEYDPLLGEVVKRKAENETRIGDNEYTREDIFEKMISAGFSGANLVYRLISRRKEAIDLERNLGI